MKTAVVANQNAPCKNAQVVCVSERIDRVRDNIHEQRLKNLGNARRRRLLGSLNARKRELDGEQLRRDNRNQRRDERAEHIHNDDGLHRSIGMGIRQSGNNQEENQNRSHGLQRTNEQAAKNGNARDGRSAIHVRENDAKNSANDQEYEDSLDQADIVPLVPQGFQGELLSSRVVRVGAAPASRGDLLLMEGLRRAPFIDYKMVTASSR